jgi:hypothetical protein
VNLGIGGAELWESLAELIGVAGKRCFGVGVDHGDMGEAVDRETWRAFRVAVEEAVGGQVRARGQS